MSNGNPRATMWRDGKIIDLTPDVAVYESSWASSINDGGKWTGSVQLEELPPWHGFVAEGFARTPIGHLGGGSSFPNDINNAGQVVGSSYSRIVDGVEQVERAFLWQNGVMTDLGVLPDDAESAAVAINSFGIIVGSSSRTNMATFQETYRPFIYERVQVRHDAILVNPSVIVGQSSAGFHRADDDAGVIRRRRLVRAPGCKQDPGCPDDVDQRRDEHRRKIRDQELYVHREPVEGDDRGREREPRDGEWLRDRSGGLHRGVRHARVQRMDR